MEDDAPLEVEPTKMGLEGGTLGGCDAIVECRNEHGAGFVDHEARHRDVWVIEHGGAWTEMDFDACRLNRGGDKSLPSRLAITEANFVQALGHGVYDFVGQRWIGDKSRQFDFWKARRVRAVKKAIPDQALLAKINEKARAQPPELAVAHHLNPMLWSERATQTLQFWNEVIFDHKVRLKGVRDDSAIDQVTSRLGKMRDASCCECRDKLLMINLLIKPWPDR